MAITCSLNGNITCTDGQTGTVAYTKLLSALSTVGSAFIEAQTASAGTGGLAISLPVSPAQFVYVKNLHPSQTLSLTWTPNGGSSAPNFITLQPGSANILVEVAGGSGITALTATGSAASTTFEYFIVG